LILDILKKGSLNGDASRVWDDGEKYKGKFKKGIKQGNGAYYWKNGAIYDGRWKSDLRKGKATMIWPTGFKYSGKWERDEPKDTDSCVHPLIKQCKEKDICTVVITQKTIDYGQFLFICLQCQKGFCSTCKKDCHLVHSSLREEWRTCSYCSCADSDTCVKKGHL